MQKQPLLILLIFCIIGIVTAEYFREMMPKTEVLLGIFTLFIGLLFLFKTKLLWLKTWLIGCSLSVLFAFFHFQNTLSQSSIHFEGKQKIQFRLVKKFNSTEKYKKYQAEIIAIEGQRNLPAFQGLINVDKSLPDLDFNHIYQAETYINRLVSTAHDFQFDYTQYLARQGIDCQLFVNDYYAIYEREISLLDKVKQYRLELLHRINESQLSPTTRSFLKGIILADRTDMERELVTDFQRTGLAHLLAISGGHIVVIFGLIFFIVNKIPLLNYRGRIIISLVAVWLFAMLIDFGNSVVRSSLMLTIYYVSILMGRTSNLLHSACFSALIVLAVDTQNFFDVGFQLSYLAVIGISLFHLPLLNVLYRGHSKWKRWLFSICTITISAQIGTFPIVLYYFHQYSLVSFFANLIIIPFFEIVIVVSCFMAVFYAFEIAITEMEWIYDGLVKIVLWLIRQLGKWDMMFIERISFGFLEMLMAFVVIYLVYRWLVARSSSPFLWLVGVVVFCAVRLGVQEYWEQKKEFLEVTNFKDKVLIVKDKKRVQIFISEDKNNDKDLHYLKRFIIEPYRISRRVENVKVIFYPSETDEIKFSDGNVFTPEI